MRKVPFCGTGVHHSKDGSFQYGSLPCLMIMIHCPRTKPKRTSVLKIANRRVPVKTLSETELKDKSPVKTTSALKMAHRRVPVKALSEKEPEKTQKQAMMAYQKSRHTSERAQEACNG